MRGKRGIVGVANEIEPKCATNLSSGLRLLVSNVDEMIMTSDYTPLTI